MTSSNKRVMGYTPMNKYVEFVELWTNTIGRFQKIQLIMVI